MIRNLAEAKQKLELTNRKLKQSKFIVWARQNGSEVFQDIKLWTIENPKTFFVSSLAFLFVIVLLIVGSIIHEYGFITPIVTLVSIAVAYSAYKAGGWKTNLSISFEKRFSYDRTISVNNDSLLISTGKDASIDEKMQLDNELFYFEIIKFEVRNSGRTDLRFDIPKLLANEKEMDYTPNPIFVAKNKGYFKIDYVSILEAKPGEVYTFYYSASEVIRTVNKKIDKNTNNTISFFIVGNDGKQQKFYLNNNWKIEERKNLFPFTPLNQTSSQSYQINEIANYALTALSYKRTSSNFREILDFTDYIYFVSVFVNSVIDIIQSPNKDGKPRKYEELIDEYQDSFSEYLNFNKDSEHLLKKYLASIARASVKKHL